MFYQGGIKSLKAGKGFCMKGNVVPETFQFAFCAILSRGPLPIFDGGTIALRLLNGKGSSFG